ncbi:unnamed protein product [Hyaloperonospora brassicae]|uniref:RxLR effector candidate protein n=1 Tax=Hyaloperonospora brassicae TaxID=162125 RepID=A0AAV0UPW5_HYABA|nr:unnamed protein product [Hyaloperonospora brassicae]
MLGNHSTMAHDDGLIESNEQEQRREDRAMPGLSTIERFLARFGGVFHDIERSQPIEDFVTRMDTNKVIVAMRIEDTGKFVNALAEELNPTKIQWDYEKVVMTLAGYKNSGNKMVTKGGVYAGDLIRAFHQLRDVADMREPADRMQRFLSVIPPYTLDDVRLKLWLKAKLTPEQAFEILPSGYRFDLKSINKKHGELSTQIAYFRAVDPLEQYIERYRVEVQQDYSKDAEDSLLKLYTDQLSNLPFKWDTKTDPTL